MGIREMTVADDQDSKQKRTKQLTRNSSKLKRRPVATAETSPKKQKERYLTFSFLHLFPSPTYIVTVISPLQAALFYFFFVTNIEFTHYYLGSFCIIRNHN